MSKRYYLNDDIDECLIATWFMRVEPIEADQYVVNLYHTGEFYMSDAVDRDKKALYEYFQSDPTFASIPFRPDTLNGLAHVELGIIAEVSKELAMLFVLTLADEQVNDSRN